MTHIITKDFIYIPQNDLTGTQAEALSGVYQKAKQAYRIPYTLGALRELHRLGFSVTQDGMTLKKHLEHRNRLKSSPHVTDTSHLRSYQQQDVQFLLHGSGANFSEPRTGKTPTMCEVLETLQKKTVILCPASLVVNWQDEIHRFTDLQAVAVMGTLTKRKKLYTSEWDVLVLSKDTAKQDVDLLTHLDYDVVVVDEAHFLRNIKTQQSQAVYRIGSRATYRYALTGTPATNAPQDVFGILKFLEPEKYPSYWQFVERYFTVEEGRFGRQIGQYRSPSRQKEFQEIVEAISTQRKRRDVMKWLPDTTFQTVRLEMDTKQRKAYNEMLEFFEVEGTDISAPSVLAQMTRLRQLTTCPSTLGLTVPSAKEQFLLEWVQDNPTTPVIIFSTFSSYLKDLHTKLKGAQIITGSTPKDERARIVKNFQEGTFTVLLANIEAAGTGLTLDRAEVAIFLDRSYTPTSNDQAQDRLVATTQTAQQKAHVIDLVVKDTIDEKILKLVKEKKNITQIVNDYAAFKKFMNS